MVRVDLQLLIFAWIEMVAVFAVETTTQFYIVWRPLIVPGNYYERLDTPPDQTDFMKGSKCLDICANAFSKGPWICRYLMIEPLQEDWEETITQAIDFVNRVREMRVKSCYLFEAQEIEGDLATKFFVSKGFINPANNEHGTHIALELVAEGLQPWPNPLADAVIPDHLEMDTRLAKYFNETGTCPWHSNTTTTDSVSLSTVADESSTQMTTTAAEEVSTVILYSMICGSVAAHSFNVAKCPKSTDVPRIIYESEFAGEEQNDCDLQPYMAPSASGGLYSAVNYPTLVEGWCSTNKTCGFAAPLYKMKYRYGNVVTNLVVSTPDVDGSVLCYAKSSTKITSIP